MSSRNLVDHLPVVLDVLSDDSENKFLEKKATISSAAASTFRQGNRQSASTFSHDVVKENTGTDHKTYSFSPAGLQLCSKTSTNTNRRAKTHIVTINVLEICRHLSDLKHSFAEVLP